MSSEYLQRAERSVMSTDVKSNAYEALLEKNAQDTKSVRAITLPRVH